MKKTYYKKIFFLLILAIKFVNINCKLEYTFYKTNIPPFGQVEFKGTVDLLKEEFAFVNEPTKKTYNVGILKIQDLIASISNLKGLTLQATASIFNQTGTLSLEEFVPSGINKRSIFSLTPKNIISLPTPWKDIKISKLSLLVTPEKKELIATASLFEKNDAQINFGKIKETGISFVKIYLKNLNAKKISKKSNIDFVNFENLEITIEDPFKKEEHPATLKGIVNIKLPGKLGEISSEFESQYAEKKLDILVKTNKSISIANGKIKLENTKIKFSTDGELTISGDTNIFNTDLTGYLTFTKLTEEEEEEITENNFAKIGNFKIEFEGELKNGKVIKPFEKFSKLPKKIRNIQVKDPKIGLSANKNFYLSGKVKTLNFESEAEISLGKNKQIALKIKPPKNWVKENLLTGKVFDQLSFPDTYIVISSYQYRNEVLNITINKGFNVISGVKILENSRLDILFNINKKLLLSGSFGTNLSDMSLSIAVPIDVQLNKNISLQNISLIISGAGDLGAKFQINLKKPNLLLTGSFIMDPVVASVGVQGSMEGKWNNPLGVKGISISNTASEFAISLTPPVPVPTNVGITGALEIGSVKAMAAVKLDVTGQGGIIAKINSISLDDLLSIPQKLTPQIDWNKLRKSIPPIVIYDVDYKAAPVPFKVGEIFFEAGINLKGRINILNKFKALVDCKVGENGIIGKGTATEIKIGKIFILTGAGFDEIYGTEDDGPTVNLELTPKNQKLMVSGQGKLLGVEGKTEAYIGKKGINFLTMYDVLGSGILLEGKSQGSLKDLNSLDFKIHGAFKNDLVEYMANRIEEKLGSVAKSITEFYGATVFPFRISKIEIWSSLKEFTKGKLPRTKIEAVFLGKKLTIDEQLDLTKPDKMLWHLTKSILNGMEQFITNLPANIAKKFSKTKDQIFNTSKEIIEIIKRGNVIFNNNTQHKIKIKADYSLIGSKKTYEDIIISPNDSLSKMMQKNLRNMDLYIEDKNRNWKLVNSWPGNENIIKTYDYKTIYIDIGYFPDKAELYKKYGTQQSFRRRIREGKKVKIDWFSEKEKSRKNIIRKKENLINILFQKYLNRDATQDEIKSFLKLYPQKYQGIIDKTQTEKIEEIDKIIEQKIMDYPEVKTKKIINLFLKYYKRKPTDEEISIYTKNWNIYGKDSGVENLIQQTSPQNRKNTIAKWIKQFTNKKATQDEINYYFENWDKLKGLQVKGRIRNSQAAQDARKNLVIKSFEKYHGRKPTSTEIEKFTRYEIWKNKTFDNVEKLIKETKIEKQPSYTKKYHSADNKKDHDFIKNNFIKYHNRNPFIEEVDRFIDLWNEQGKTEEDVIEAIKNYKFGG
ncbi:hypothetical protein GF385_04870 [Candidatus Dependentiae bacterium]|nr:hypothetical protein [Candidatus Dependentiae bacterium]